jgi:hypothetical protein
MSGYLPIKDISATIRGPTTGCSGRHFAAIKIRAILTAGFDPEAFPI